MNYITSVDLVPLYVVAGNRMADQMARQEQHCDRYASKTIIKNTIQIHNKNKQFKTLHNFLTQLKSLYI